VRRFACVICPGGWYAKARAEGFRKTVEKAGFPCCTHVIKAHYREVSRPQEMTEADLRQLEAWLAGLRTPVGLFWTEDHLGEQLLRACRRCGLRVPQDVAVVSAPNRTSYCEAFDPPFSSVNSFEEEIGYLAAHWLDRLMSGEKMKTSPQTVPPSHVVTRKSSDTFAADDPDVARALQYIYEHLAEGINASEVINKLNLSRRTFYRRFEATTGQSPQAFIQNRRVRVALDIIAKDASLSLQEVALRCGFRDRNRMNLTIMNETGKTPQSWREEHRRAAEAADPLGMKES
jgi:LacI family transcriptional regulator